MVKKQPQPKQELTAFELKERRERTVFVGNVPLEATHDQIKRAFKECEGLEKVWFRSLPT